MIAKINRCSSIFGALIYNQQKVDAERARIISGHRMVSDMTGRTNNAMQHALFSFENYLLANKRTEKPVLHISLNPSPEDNLTDEHYSRLAKEYMERMGYGDQPYIVYRHEDIERHHIHIVSVCVDENGKKINDSYEKMRSMNACRELEVKFGLKQITDEDKELSNIFLQKVDPQRGDIKRQMSNVLKTVAASYKYQSFGEYNVLLSCFNMQAQKVNGEFEGVPYDGVIYFATDDKGKQTGVPIKSSLFGKDYGHKALEKRMKRNTADYKDGKFAPKIKEDIMRAKISCRGREDFIDRLKLSGIDVMFRTSDTGRIYGATFIDHTNKEVYNGSRLGKEFSANVFNELFSQAVQNKTKGQSVESPFESATAASQADSLVETFGVFGFEPHGHDYEEEEFARRIRRKKRKKKRHIPKM